MGLDQFRASFYNGFRQVALQFISAEEFNIIEEQAVFLKFQKGETILKQGHKPTHVAFLQSGIVKFNFQSSNGKDTILTLVSAPKVLGGANLFYSDNNLFSIVAVEDSEVCLFDTNELFELMKNNGNFAVAMFQLVSEMFKKSIVNFVSVANKQKEARIADVFLYLTEEVYRSNSFKLSLTRKEVAEYACCSVENVIMTLSKWQQEDLILVSGKNFRINDIDKLKYISKIG